MQEKPKETRIRVLSFEEVEARVHRLYKQEQYLLERARGLEAQALQMYRDASRISDKIIALYEVMEGGR